MRTGGTTNRLRVGLMVLAVVLAVAIALLTPAGALAFDLGDPIVITQAASGDKPEAPHITAKAAVIMDMDTGTILYSRNADAELAMASTTKIMTAILTLESLPLDRKITVPAAARNTPAFVLGLRPGQTFTVEQILYAALVPSANDAAVTLGVAVAGSVPAFVAQMNARAQKMGLTHTHFATTNGLPAADQHSSAKDIATLASYAMHNPVFRRIVATREYRLPIPGAGVRLLKTTNLLLRDNQWVNGIKTGYTDSAGYCLVASATKDGLTLISVELGAKDDITRRKESKALLTYGFERCAMKNLVDGGAVIADVPVPDPIGQEVRLVTASPYSRRLLGEDEVTGRVTLSWDMALPVEAGEVLGELEFSQGKADLGSVPLIAAKTVKLPTLRMILDHMYGPWSAGLTLPRFLASVSG